MEGVAALGLLALGEGQPCSTRRQAFYRRQGYVCVAGTLQTPWRSLYRPLHVPRIEPGAPCPVTAQTTRIRGFDALGPGPAAPMGSHSSITISFPTEFGPEWGGTKRVWLLASSFAGRALVRGRQLDGPNEVRFVYGRPAFTPEKLLSPVRELRLEGYRDYPSLTRLRAPGCYAYQVDGRRFHYLLVFEARLAE